MALFAAGAFAYALRPPGVPQPDTSVASVRPALIPSVPPPAAAMHREAATIIVLPPTVIAENRPRRAILPPPMPRARELSEMTCSGWRPLEQGDRRQLVRSCD